MKKFLLLLIALFPLFLVGCGSTPQTIEKDLGRLPAEEKGVSNTAERRAMLELAVQTHDHPDGSVFIIKCESVWPSGFIIPITITYNRQDQTLQRQGEKGRGLVYSNVTDDVISQTVGQAELAEDVEKHGASRVPHPLEKSP